MRIISENEILNLGEYSFITSLQRQETAVSQIFCKVYFIKREKFLTLIKKNNKSHQIFSELKDNILLNVMKPSKELALLEFLKGTAMKSAL